MDARGTVLPSPWSLSIQVDASAFVSLPPTSAGTLPALAPAIQQIQVPQTWLPLSPPLSRFLWMPSLPAPSIPLPLLSPTQFSTWKCSLTSCPQPKAGTGACLTATMAPVIYTPIAPCLSCQPGKAVGVRVLFPDSVLTVQPQCLAHGRHSINAG